MGEGQSAETTDEVSTAAIVRLSRVGVCHGSCSQWRNFSTTLIAEGDLAGGAEEGGEGCGLAFDHVAGSL